MGKILKGIALLAASAVGTYYYKNPKELEKHKEELEQEPQTTIRGGDKKNKLTPDKLKERE